MQKRKQGLGYGKCGEFGEKDILPTWQILSPWQIQCLIKLELSYRGDYNSVQAQIIALRLNLC